VSGREVSVCFVLLAWNRPDLEARCIASVRAQTDPNWLVIVVDNGSSPPFALAGDAARDRRVRLIRSERNLGYAAGMNLGLSAAEGEYLVPINGDVVLREDYVAQLRGRYEECMRGRIGSLAPLVIRGTPEQPQGIECKGWYLSGRFSVVADRFISDGAEVFSGSGACCPYLAQAVWEVCRGRQVFDSSYFAYGEDLDLQFRLHYAGWRCRYAASLVGWHLGSAYSTEKGSALDADPSLQSYILANRVRNIVKYLSLRDLLWLGPPIFVTEVGMLLSCLFLGRPRPGAYRRAYAAVWADRGKLLQERGEALRRRRMPSRELRRLTRGI